jgi:hypothetical protein
MTNKSGTKKSFRVRSITFVILCTNFCLLNLVVDLGPDREVFGQSGSGTFWTVRIWTIVPDQRPDPTWLPYDVHLNVLGLDLG